MALNTTEVLKDRCSRYQFLARVYCQELSIESLQELVAAKRFGQADGGGKRGILIGKFIDSIAGRSLEQVYLEMLIRYAGLFLNAGDHPVPPYESVYSSPDPVAVQQTRDAIVREYESEGFEPLDRFNRRADHIAFELEFMRHLGDRTLDLLEHNDHQAAARCLEKQTLFLAQHLEVWVPRFCERIGQAHPGDFYLGVAQLTQDLVASDRQTIRELLTEQRQPA